MGREYHGSRLALFIQGRLLCQPFRLFRTEMPADRGYGSHGSHCIGPPGLSSQKHLLRDRADIKHAPSELKSQKDIAN
jgi:hypothetical protein